MDNGASNILPIIIGIIIFIIKIVSDANKKQKQQAKKPSGSVKQSQYGQKNDPRSSGNNWENSRIKENEYRSLDPNFIPKPLPDVDYDKMSNVSVQPEQPDAKTEPITAIKKTESMKLISIRRKLKEPDTVKELFLLSEIFNKPKAHNKWRKNTH